MMTNITKLENKLEWIDNLWAWKYKVLLIPEEAWRGKYVKEEAADLEGDEDKAQEGLSQSQEDYFYLHWISHVSSLKIPKDMFDAITSLYEGNIINKNMTLRTQLKDVKMQMS